MNFTELDNLIDDVESPNYIVATTYEMEAMGYDTKVLASCEVPDEVMQILQLGSRQGQTND